MTSASWVVRTSAKYRRSTLAGIGLVAFAVALAFQGTRPLHETSEGRYALAAQELLHSHRWLKPTLDGAPHWTKPPLTYWAMAAGMGALGENAWGVRVPGAMAHALTAVLVAWIGVTLFGSRIGSWAGWIYGVGWLPQAAAHTATTDVYLALATTAAGAAFVGSISVESDQGRRRWISLMWLALGVAFLTKGPPGLLPLLAVTIWRLALPPQKRPPWITGYGGLAFIFVGLGTYLVVIAQDPSLLSRFFSIAVGTNLLGHGAHNPEWWKGIPVFGPPLLLGLGLPGIAALLRVGWRRKGIPWRQWWRQGDPSLFLILWILLPLAVFASAGNKLPLYVLPLTAPLALVTSIVLTPVLSRHTMTIVLMASAVAVLAAKAHYAHAPSRRDMGALAHEVESALSNGKSPRASIALATPELLYGLQFYLGRPLMRPPADPEPEEVQTFVAGLLLKRQEGEFADGLLFIVPDRSATELKSSFNPVNDELMRTTGRYWQTLLLPAAVNGD